MTSMETKLTTLYEANGLLYGILHDVRIQDTVYVTRFGDYAYGLYFNDSRPKGDKESDEDFNIPEVFDVLVLYAKDAEALVKWPKTFPKHFKQSDALKEIWSVKPRMAMAGVVSHQAPELIFTEKFRDALPEPITEAVLLAIADRLWKYAPRGLFRRVVNYTIAYRIDGEKSPFHSRLVFRRFAFRPFERQEFLKSYVTTLVVDENSPYYLRMEDDTFKRVLSHSERYMQRLLLNWVWFPDRVL